MCRRWTGPGLLLAALAAFAGCWTTDQPIKPPPRPEEFLLPPAHDARFSSYPTYPEKTLNQGLLKKDRDPSDPPSVYRGPSKPGMPGAGAMGGPP